jgi:hypothetical protein
MIIKYQDGHKIDQRLKKYSNIFQCKGPPPKNAQIGILGFKIYHLATLVRAAVAQRKSAGK